MRRLLGGLSGIVLAVVAPPNDARVVVAQDAAAYALGAVEGPLASETSPCELGSQALFRGRPADAEQVARQVLAEDLADAHAEGRCWALLGRALLAQRSDDATLAEAARALRQAHALSPGQDLRAPLVTAHWLSERERLPIRARRWSEATGAERAVMGTEDPAVRVRTLRDLLLPRGRAVGVHVVERGERIEVAASACTRGGCTAAPLLVLGPGQDGRIVRVGVVARGSARPEAPQTALVVEMALSRRGWRGRVMFVRWIEDGAVRGWNALLERSDRVGLRGVVEVDFAAPGRIVVAGDGPARRGQRARRTTSIEALDCGGCWLGDVSPP